ncbi:MAG: hypothetical protein V4587_02995, partial [Acidobacteriota bacterium]
MSNQAVMQMANGDPQVSEWYGLTQGMATTNVTGTIVDKYMTGTYVQTHGCMPDFWYNYYRPIYYNSTPLIIEDKTKKAFAIAKKCIKS